jgi:hypothetical protein
MLAHATISARNRCVRNSFLRNLCEHNHCMVQWLHGASMWADTLGGIHLLDWGGRD